MSSPGGLPQFDYLNKDAIVISTSVFCALTILANLFMMIAILRSPKLRTSPKHVLIFVLCLSDLYSGFFEYPLYAQFYSLEKWIHSANVFTFLTYESYLMNISLRMTLVISICLNAILNLLTRNKKIILLLSVSLIIASVGYSLLFVLPVTERTHANNYEPYVWLVLSPAGFFPKAFMIVVLSVDIIIMHRSFSRSLPEGIDEEPRTLPVDVLTACVLMIVHYTPSTVVNTYYSSCTYFCSTMYISLGVTQQWESLRSCIMPFVWLLCRETRTNIRQSCYCRREPPSNLTENII